jgi:hypothetical protein
VDTGNWYVDQCSNNEDDRVMWRICYKDGAEDLAGFMGFARRKDALMALRGQLAAGYDTPEKCEAAVYLHYIQVQIEALQW